MFKKIKKMFGLVPSPEKWDEMKSEGLVAILGVEHDVVMHAIIPFCVGGALDLYYYPQKIGYAIATKELIDEFGEGPYNDVHRSYEFCMFAKPKFDLGSAKDKNSEMGKSHDELNRVLNALAKYSFQASLNPNETMEFPNDFDDVIGGYCLILDSYTNNGGGLFIGGKQFGLMCAIIIHRSEMDFAIKNGGDKLISLLKKAGVYPYSDLNRDPVA